MWPSAAMSASPGPQLSPSEQQRLITEHEFMRSELASMRALQQSQAQLLQAQTEQLQAQTEQLQAQTQQLEAQTQQLQALLVSSQAESESAAMRSLTQVQFCRQLQGMEGILVRNNVLHVMQCLSVCRTSISAYQSSSCCTGAVHC